MGSDSVYCVLLCSSSCPQRSQGPEGSGSDPAAGPPELGGPRARRRQPADRIPGGEAGRLPQDLGQGTNTGVKTPPSCVPPGISWNQNISPLRSNLKSIELYPIESWNSFTQSGENQVVLLSSRGLQYAERTCQRSGNQGAPLCFDL